MKIEIELSSETCKLLADFEVRNFKNRELAESLVSDEKSLYELVKKGVEYAVKKHRDFCLDELGCDEDIRDELGLDYSGI